MPTMPPHLLTAWLLETRRIQTRQTVLASPPVGVRTGSGRVAGGTPSRQDSSPDGASGCRPEQVSGARKAKIEP